jgi:acyl carrier protein
MSREAILNQIATTLADVLDVNSVTLTEAMSAEEVDGWDSIAYVKLVIALEGIYGIRFEPDEIGTPESVGDLVSLVSAKQAAA